MEKKIFIVDNDAGVTSQLAKYLVEEDYEVIVSNDGMEAIQVLESEVFDLVIADIYISGLDSFAVLNWLTVHKPETKVIMITGYDSRSVSHAAIRMGALFCLDKPISRGYLLETVHEALSEEGFSGTISKITLADYLQLCIYTTASKAFEIIKGSKKGVIIIKDGVITYSEHGDLKGVDAFNEILSWGGGRINEIRLPNAPLPNISMDSNFLLLEATRLHDENTMMAQQEEAAAAEETLIAPLDEMSIGVTGEDIPGTDITEEISLGEVPFEMRSGKSRIAEELDKEGVILEYGIFNDKDQLLEKSSSSPTIEIFAKSDLFQQISSLAEISDGKSLKYATIHTRSGVRYLLFPFENRQVVVGLEQGVRPADFFRDIVRKI